MDDHLVHTKPNPHPPKMDVLPKTFFQITLAAKYLSFAFSYVCFFFYVSNLIVYRPGPW